MNEATFGLTFNESSMLKRGKKNTRVQDCPAKHQPWKRGVIKRSSREEGPPVPLDAACPGTEGGQEAAVKCLTFLSRFL